MKSAWQRVCAALLVTALASAEPCLDGLGRLHPEGDMFYDFPDTIRPCRVYKCSAGRKEVIRDTCGEKEYHPSGLFSPSSLRPGFGRFLHSKSSLHSEEAASLKPAAPIVYPNTSPVPRPFPVPSKSDTISESSPRSSFQSGPETSSSSTSSESDSDAVSSDSSASPSTPPPSPVSVVSRRHTSLRGQLQVSSCTAQNGRRYYESQRWWETTDRPCLHYVCRSSQKLLLENVTCPAIPDGCSAKNVFGRCCPEPTNCVSTTPPPVVPQTCTSTSGQIYLSGQSWSETDERPCLRYTCVAGESRLVQNITCDPLTPLCLGRIPLFGRCCDKPTRCGCVERTADGTAQVRQHDEVWTSDADPCVTKRCDEGRITEQRRSPQPQPCPAAPAAGCEQIPPPPGVCACPTYQCVSTTEATSETPTAAPSARPTPEPSTEPVTATNEPPTATTKRPDGSCEFEGTIYKNQSNWQDECASHVCLDGKVVSGFVQCPGPIGPSCAPIYQPGSCCVRWSCQGIYIDHCTAKSSYSFVSEQHLCYRPGLHEGLCSATRPPVPGHCCPVYECLKNCADHSGQPHQHGTSWEENCSIYSCDNGTATSSPKECPPPGDSQCRRTNPGECCPIYDCGCIDDDGTRHEHGTHWNSNCQELDCKHGFPNSRPVTCPDAPRPDCTPLPITVGRCCPEFNCSCDSVTCPSYPSASGCQQSGTSADGCCTLYTCEGDCRDDLNRVHTDGSSWFVGCAQYRCSAGNIEPVTEPCPPAPHENCTAVYLKGDSDADGNVCCPIYDCAIPECVPGERSFDGCNHCQCLHPGKLICTENICTEKGCSIDTLASGVVTKEHGATWSSEENPCYEYTCQYGVIRNKVKQCPPKPGAHCTEKPITGICCPDWDCPSSACPEGELTSPRSWQDDCNICTCTDSGVLCTDFDCHKKCEKDGDLYATQEEIPATNQCEERICIDGVAVSVYESCSLPPANATCSAAEAFSGDCCPSWFCTGLEGVPSPCQPGQLYQGDQECMFCECVDAQGAEPAQMVCSKRDCVRAGCDDDGTYHEHGSVWISADPCKQYACVSGRTITMEVKCPPTPPGCMPVPNTGRCCPLLYCGEPCDYGPEPRAHGCNSCVCRDGIEYCTTDQCDD